jgi:membrane associated rhomboid family serine protease
MDEFSPSYSPMPAPPRPWVTWGIIGSTVAVFLLQLVCVHFYGEDTVGDALAFSPAAWSEHRYWTLLTYAWAHATVLFDDPGLFWLHIVANMVPLFCLGPALEEYLGHARFLGLYLGGAIAAALVWFVFNRTQTGPDAGIIGASGAVFAIITGAATVAPRARIVVFLFYVLPLRTNLLVLALVACAIELAQILFGWMTEVAHSAHLGGAVFGCLYVLASRWLLRRRRLYPV